MPFVLPLMLLNVLCQGPTGHSYVCLRAVFGMSGSCGQEG